MSETEKGKLKIFFGYSAGVGKTFSMLSEARELKEKGADVVIGYIEPHSRPDTEKLMEGFEIIPPIQSDYRGIVETEFDLQKALTRKPELILVDELAHTNSSVSKNSKRFLDVMELLNDGINVFTTLNVQHIEGLNDLVGSVTDIRVGETIPDDVFDEATEVKLVDIEPDELISRFRAGKIYSPTQTTLALEHFFTQDHLNSLREISMRRMAERISRKNGTIGAETRILSLISPSPSSARNIRVAARMAGAYKTDFVALYIESGSSLTPESQNSLKAHMKLVTDLGGHFIVRYGYDILDTIRYYVIANGITQIVIGKTWDSEKAEVSLANQIVSLLPDVETLIVPDRETTKKTKVSVASKPSTQSLIIVLGSLLFGITGTALVFVLPWVSIGLVLLSLASLAFFGIRFEINTKRERDQFSIINKAQEGYRELLKNALSKRDRKRVDETAKILSRLFSRSIEVFHEGGFSICEVDGDDAHFSSEKERSACLWSQKNLHSAGQGSDSLRNTNAFYFPIPGGALGTDVIGLSCAIKPLSLEDRLLLYELTDALKIVLEGAPIYPLVKT